MFVCVGNSCRSQMAEGFAREFGAGVINPASAGLSSSRSIARETVEVMRERGIDITDQFPKDFERGLAEHYDIVVNLSGFTMPGLKRPVMVEWNVQDPNGFGIVVHRAVRNEIERRVTQLIADLKAHGKVVDATALGQRIAPIPPRRPRLWQRFTIWR